MWGGVGRCWEMWGDVGRCRGDVGRYGEVWGDVGRCGGGVGRCGEMLGRGEMLDLQRLDDEGVGAAEDATLHLVLGLG